MGIALTFEAKHLPTDLARRSARGAVATVVGRAGRFGIQLAGMAILSRLLKPADFGLVNIVAVITGVMAMLGDLGLSSAVIQRAQITRAQVSTLFWVNTCIGLVLGLITVALAPAIVMIYRDDRLFSIAIVLGSGFLLGGLGIQHQALLKRQMLFSTLVKIDLLAAVVATAIAVGAAFAGCGYWSLVILQIATAAISTALSWLFCSWRPSLPSRNSGVRSMLFFGGNVTIFNFLNYLVRNMDNALIGWRWGTVELGFYSRAYQLMLLPLSQIVGPIGAVAVPALSRLQDDPDRYRDYYLRGLKMIVYASVPSFMVMAALSDQIIAVLLGPQWGPAARIFRILALAAVFQPIVSTTGWVLTSLNQVKVMAVWGAIAAPVMLSAFLIGLHWGAIGVATSYTVGDCLLSVPALLIASRLSPIRMADIGGVIYRPMLLAAAAGVMLWAFQRLYPALANDRPLAFIAASLLGCVFLLAVIIAVFATVRGDLLTLLSNVEQIWRKPQPTS